ncbi:MAG: phosphoglycerate mutase family protein, partial [bacterium]|nr:phosphoglycerate mutase family protein [bacterium]
MRNQYYIIRHGHSLKNKKGIASCWPEKSQLPLTKKGKQEIKEAAKELKKRKVDELRSSPRRADACVIDLIFSSDLLRT